MSDNSNLCTLCGEPLPEGEQMFKYHGYSGPCPKPPTPRPPAPSSALTPELVERCARAAFCSQFLVTKWEDFGKESHDAWRETAMAVLAEALPAIRAQALRECKSAILNVTLGGAESDILLASATLGKAARRIEELEAQP